MRRFLKEPAAPVKMCIHSLNSQKIQMRVNTCIVTELSSTSKLAFTCSQFPVQHPI